MPVPGHDPDLENTYIYKTVSPVPEYIPEYFSGNEKCRNAAVLCSAGLGVSIFPETFITYSQYDFSHHCFYTIEDYDSKNIIVLNYRNTRYLSKTIQAFVNTVREVVDAQTGLGANR